MLTKKQLEMRRTGIGASEMAAVMGMSRWRTPLQVYIDKVSTEPVDATVDPDESPHLYWGHRLEAVVADEFTRRNGVRLQKCGTIRHARIPWMLATVDRLIVEGSGNLPVGGLECKTDYDPEKWGEVGSDDVPIEYIIQCHQCMMVMELREWNLATLIRGNDYREYKIERSDQICEFIELHGNAFWSRVQRKEPPEPKPSDNLVELFPLASAGRAVTATPEVANLCTALAVAKGSLKAAATHVDAIENRIKFFMGDAESLLSPFNANEVLATWKSSARRVVNTKALKEDKELYSRFSTSVPTRTFLNKVKGDDK